jgi:hypothetical protein
MGEGREREMAQIMYAHVNKRIKKKKKTHHKKRVEGVAQAVRKPA